MATSPVHQPQRLALTTRVPDSFPDPPRGPFSEVAPASQAWGHVPSFHEALNPCATGWV
jgi:hypothetical protein